MENIDKILSRNLKTLRDSHGMTQAEFAEKLKVDVQTIRNWESGRRWPSNQYIDLIAKTFNTEPSYLFIDSSIAIEGLNKIVIDQEKKIKDLENKLREKNTAISNPIRPKVFSESISDILAALTKATPANLLIIRAVLGLDTKRELKKRA